MYYIIHGTFIIDRDGLGPYMPDGDTIRFEPDNPQHLARLPRRGAQPKSPASIRFEAIDALEKDQNLAQAKAPRDKMFELLGLGQVSIDFSSGGFQIQDANAGESRGYILANSLDKYGRIIAFVFAGESGRPDGSVITPTQNDIDQSVNWQLIEAGLVYPTFYSTLHIDLMEGLVVAARTAREANTGLWSKAVGTPSTPAVIQNIGELKNLVLFPTLHRRLDDYLVSNFGFDNLANWLRSDNESRNKTVQRLTDGVVTDLAGILDTAGDQIRLTLDPDTFVFVDGPPIVCPEGCTPPGEPPEKGEVVITGVLINAKGPERGNEYVTLLNTTDRTVDLAGWHLHDNNKKQPLIGLLPAGASLRIAVTKLQLANKKDEVRLVDASENEIDKVSWSKKQPEGKTVVFDWPRV
jgi:endonuclease YncB( thermonuclease family)